MLLYLQYILKITKTCYLKVCSCRFKCVCLLICAHDKFNTFHLTEPPEDPIFYVQPLNITVQPINAVTRGAFSCAVFPSKNVQSINWYFAPAGSGSVEMPIEPMQISPDSNTMVRYSGGTSVLILDSVGMEQEGAYHCVVVTTTGSSVDSEVAHLTFSGENYTVELYAWKSSPIHWELTSHLGVLFMHDIRHYVCVSERKLVQEW